MAKLVAYTGSQAAAGVPSGLTASLLSPAGIGAIAGTAAAGWVLGTVVGQSVREDRGVWEADEIIPGHLPSDAQELLAVWGVAGASVLSWQLLQQLAAQFGWKTLGLYTLGLGAIVAYRRL